jgi:peroxiredoxin
MRTSWLVVIALLGAGVALGFAGAETQDLSSQGRAEAGRGLIGSPAPRIVLKTIDGHSIDLGKLYGKKAVYMKFWATWCIPCREQMPHFERTYQTAGANLAVIAINLGMNDSLEGVKNFRRKARLTMPIVIDDGRLAAAFHLRVTPLHIVVGRDGRILYIGHLADQRLDTALLAARSLTEQPPPPAEGAVRTIARYGVGDRLPDITTTTLDGETFRARDSGDKRPTVLVFFTPWCESYLAGSRPEVATRCRQVREQVDSLAKRSPGIRWLGVASGLWATQGELSDYQAQNKTIIPLTLDESGVWFRSFGVMNVPMVLIADAKGQLVRRIERFDAHWPDELQSMVRKW